MAPGKDDSGLPARRAALALINGVTLQAKLLTEMLPRAVQHLVPADRARAQRLATETLRVLNRADRVLGPYIKRRPQEIAHNILRLAVWEMCADGAAPHGVVNAAVSLAQEHPD
ncbi:MAG: 16S rRNA methyltransferase, partial [Alphaproteobacteria bacterium]|nr:16S rRNA methyltransferase [Alphaproteobacteria bacterium]